MNALKYRIKIVFCAACAILATMVTANAQILNIGVNFQKLNLPEQFLSSLESCKKHKHSETATYKDIETKTTYMIKGLKDGKCKLSVDGQTNLAVHVTQDCDLTPEQAKNYANSLRRYQLKKYSPRWDGDKIERDPDYLAAYKIMSDRKICHFMRDEIDNSKQIRPNLTICKPSEQIEQTASLIAKRQIVGLENDLCHYAFQLTQTKGKDDSKENEKTISFNCNLNQEQRQQYLEILEALVVPAEEGYDFSAVQRISPAEEMNFLLDNCTFSTAQ